MYILKSLYKNNVLKIFRFTLDDFGGFLMITAVFVHKNTDTEENSIIFTILFSAGHSAK